MVFKKKEDTAISLSDVYSKQARRRRRVAISVFFLAAYVILLTGAWIVIKSPMFRIREIKIQGNKNVSGEDVITLVRAEMSANSLGKRMLGFGNMLAWPDALSRKTLALLPELKSVSVEKNYRARTLTVRAEERQSFGIWCLKTLINADNELIYADNGSASISQNPHTSAFNCLWFDREGVIFKRSFSAEGSLISVVDDYSERALGPGARVLPEEFVENLFSVLRAVSDSGISIKEIRLNDFNLQEIEVTTYDNGLPSEALAKEGPKVYFSLRFPADNTAAVIKSLVSQGKFGTLEYLDFRVENRAYYK